MINVSVRNGWERLPNGFDVEFRNNIPVKVSDNGHDLIVPEASLQEAITTLSKLHVCLSEWESGERAGEHEASLYATGEEFTEVLKRLAASSAELFVERYHKPVDEDDVDWDRLEFLKDFETALEFCKLDEADINRDACFDDYVEIMHRETRRLTESGDLPLVRPE